MSNYQMVKNYIHNDLGITKEYIDNKCIDTKYIDKYKVLGDNTNFFYKETIYRVKKNEK